MQRFFWKYMVTTPYNDVGLYLFEEGNAHGGNVEQSAMLIFPVGNLLRFGFRDIASGSAVGYVGRGEDALVAPGGRYAQPVVFPVYRGEIAHADEIAPIRSHPPEGEDAVVSVVRLDPLVTGPADVVGPKGRGLQIEMV